MALRDPRDYWYLLITPIWLVHRVVKNFHFGISAFADPKNIPMSQEVQRRRKEPTKRRTDNGSLLLCLSLTRANLTSSPGSAFTRNLMNLGTNRRRNIFDCARPNEALEVAEKAPRTSLHMKISPKTGQGKKPQPRAERVLLSSSTE